MATRVFVLVNKKSSDFLKSIVDRSWKLSVSEDKRKKKSRDQNYEVFIFHDFETFNSADFRNLIKIDQNKHNVADKIFLFVTPELFWTSDTLDEGYKYVLEIINGSLSDHTVQVKFLSALSFETLLDKISGYPKRAAEVFPFYDLMKDRNELLKTLFEEYSTVHFNLIKRLVLSDQGYISYLKHEVRSLMDDKAQSNGEDLNVINSILNLTDKTDYPRLHSLVEEYKSNTRNQILQECMSVLDEIQSVDIEKNPDKNSKNKKPYKVLIVEDDADYRKILKDFFDDKFKVVDSIEPSSSETFTEAVRKRLPVEANYYDIIFLDLLFKKENRNWSGLNGIDLFKSIKKTNRFCVTPVITSLPRGTVSSLAKEIGDIEIPSEMLFTKVNGKEFLKQDINDRIVSIIKSCQENIRRKNSAYNVIMPQNGPFENPLMRMGIFDRMQGKEDQDKKGINFQKDFQEKVETAFLFHDIFLKKKNLLETDGWDGKLFSPQKKNDLTLDEVWDLLETIFTYRLIILHKAIQSKENMIEIDDGFLKKCSKRRSNISKVFLSTTLGFNTEEVKREVPEGYKQDSDLLGYEILFKNLFPHEDKFVINLKNEGIGLGMPIDEKAKQWLKEFLTRLPVYENMDELVIDEEHDKIYYEELKKGKPDVKDSFFENVTYTWIDNLLGKIITKYNTNTFVQDIAREIAENYDPNRSGNIESRLPVPLKDKIVTISNYYFEN